MNEFNELPPNEVLADPQPGNFFPVEEDEMEAEVQSIIASLEAIHHMENVAEELSEGIINDITAKVIEDYDTDLASRAEWEESMKDIMSLARLLAEQKTYAGETVSNVKYPIITNAVVQFASRAYPEIIKGTDVVKPKIVGKDPEGLKLARGKRIAEHMSYQLLNEMPAWEDGVDQLLFTLPTVGCAFKKTYRSGVLNTNVSEMVFPDDLVVHYHAESLEKAARVTHKIELTHNEIVERIRTGVYLKFDVDELGHASNVEHEHVDDDTPHLFLEQHRWYDLDGDGYQEPYIATVHYASQKLVRLAARYDIEGVERNEFGEVIRIAPVHYFTRFLFMPSPDGSFYGMGFGSLLHSINSSANTTINQLLDAGTRAVRGGGFIGRGVKLGRGATLKFKAGEWKPVTATGDDLRKNIVPMPVHEPSSVLFQLLGLMIDSGKELSGITEVLSGQSPGSNVPAETTLALIEQGLQVYSAIHKRVHRALYREFKKVRRLNVLYLDEASYQQVLDNPNAAKSADYSSSDHDIIPVSDPNSTTNMQRIMKAKALLTMKGQGLDDNEINRRYLEALQVEDIESLFPKEPAPDPLRDLAIAELQEKVGKLVAEQGEIAAKTQKVVEETNTEKMTQYVKQMGTVFDDRKLKLEEAQTLNDIKSTEATNKRETAKLINDIRVSGVKVPPVSTKASPGKTGGNDSQLSGKTAQSNSQGPYRERGMTSNNKDQE